MEEQQQQPAPGGKSPAGNRPPRRSFGAGKGEFNRNGNKGGFNNARGGRSRRGPRQGGPKPHQAPPPHPAMNGESKPNPDEKPIPPLEAGNIRIIPLGGVEEIGRNIPAVAFGEDIVI